MSLITKYRPKTLDEVIGQKTVVDNIKKIIVRKNAPKAWLLIGSAGCGKTSIARILSSHFIGGSLGQTNLIEIDAAVQNSVEEIRELTIKANYRAIGQSPIKCIIIDEIHVLSARGMDALLKSTEEPPDHVRWFFCTTNPAKIPETLKTRCVKFTLKPVKETDLFELLVKVSDNERLEVLPEVLELLAETANGSPRQALTNLEVCAQVKSLGEAKELLREPKNSKGVADLAKLLLSNRGKWTDAVNIINSLDNVEAETIRIQLMNYLAAVVMKSKSNDDAKRILFLLQCFSSQFYTSDRMAPLLLSIGAAMGLAE